jgi:localization factor PodJL
LILPWETLDARASEVVSGPDGENMLENTGKVPHAGHQDCASTAGPSRDTCGHEDLKALLHRIADHFADSDCRHRAALSDMHDRLAELGRQAHTGALKAPEQDTSAISRIEQGIAVLGEHVDEASRQASAPGPAQATAALASSTPEEVFGVLSGPSLPYQDEGVWVTRESSSSEILASIADSAELSELSRTHSVNDPWDDQTADALTRTYDPGEPALLLAAPAESASAASQAAPAAPGSADEEKAWLDARFAEIAARVEQSLASMLADSSALAIGERFHQFEQRFGSALEAVATHEDVAGLANMEAHMIELAQHVHDAHQRLSRLGAVERQLSQFTERMSEERLAKLEAPSTLSETAVNGIAAAVAEHLQGQFASLARDTTADREVLEELRHLIQELMTTQRQGDDQTASALDTVQQAMIGILDRLDALEEARGTPALAPSAVAPKAPALDQPDFGHTPQSMVEREQATLKERCGSRAAAEDAEDAVEAVSFQGPFRPAGRGAVTASDANYDAGVVAQKQPGDDADTGLIPEDELRAEGSASPAVGPVKQTREEFIAAARRAARQAANEPEEDKPQPSAATATGRRSGASASGGALGTTRGSRSRVMLAALVGLLIVGVGFTSCNKLRRGAERAAELESKLPVERNLPAPGNDAAPRLGAAGAEGTRPAEGSSGEATPIDGAGNGAAVEGGEGQGPAPQDRATRLWYEPAAPAAREASVSGQRSRAEELAEAFSTGPEPSNAAGEPGGVGALPLGVTLQTEAIPSAHEIQWSEQRQMMATLSGQLGAAQQPALQAFPVALDPDPRRQAQAQTPSTGSIARPAAHELPPALIGPMSLRVAAAKGDPSAEFEVAARFAEGKGVEQDLKQAVAWYQRAATQGFAQAQYRLATLYERGFGVKTDLGRAKIWYKRAAEQGNVKAMHNLAVLSASRDGSAPDYSVAARWFTEAAERGLADSQFNLAILYENGFGVVRDLKQAYKWTSLVAQAGDKQAARRREQIRTKLQPDELREAEDLIASWHPKPVDALMNDPRVAGEAWKTRNLGEPG